MHRWSVLLATGVCVIWPGAALGQQPPTLDTHTAIYDTLRHRMVVFGGEAIQPTNDTWGLSLSLVPEWTLLTPADTLPSKRIGHSAIYDPVRDRMLVFGGSADPGAGPP